MFCSCQPLKINISLGKQWKHKCNTELKAFKYSSQTKISSFKWQWFLNSSALDGINVEVLQGFMQLLLSCHAVVHQNWSQPRVLTSCFALPHLISRPKIAIIRWNNLSGESWRLWAVLCCRVVEKHLCMLTTKTQLFFFSLAPKPAGSEWKSLTFQTRMDVSQLLAGSQVRADTWNMVGSSPEESLVAWVRAGL